MLMKAHAYKNHNALGETIPQKSVHRKPVKEHTHTIAFTPVFFSCMWALASRTKLILKQNKIAIMNEMKEDLPTDDISAENTEQTQEERKEEPDTS